MMSAHGYVCVRCRKFYRVKRIGVYIEEMAPLGPKDENGERGWKPYKILVGDLFECETCGHQLVSGFGRGAVTEHYMKDYQRLKEALQPLFQVEDC